MGRSSEKVFKKRKGVYHPRKKDVQATKTENKTSASEKKMPNLNDSYSDYLPKFESNIIIDINVLCDMFKNFARCRNCDNGLDISLERNSGLAANLSLKCTECDCTVKFNTSPKVSENSQLYAVNLRFVYALRSIGKGAEAGRVLCGILNLPDPPTRFARYNTKLLDAVKEVASEVMSDAVKEACQESESGVDLAVGVDGSWQKRGFSSLNGVVAVTSVDTGKVLDIEVLTKFCACQNKKNHSANCKRNFSGSSGMMEVQGALAMFGRSMGEHGARYTKYLGDGDSKAYTCVKDSHPYGKNYPIEKLECVGHVQKRMGTRLFKFKEKSRGNILADGKTLAGRNRLTKEHIIAIQNYYGQAIRDNLESVEKMKQAIWAIFLHKSSTDAVPQHGFCPTGDKSWCSYNKAIATNNPPPKHKNTIPVTIMEEIRPIFKDLAHPDLLKKCLHGRTQNSNESFNHILWSRIPKTTFVQFETLSFGAYEAVCSFNVGNISRMKVLKKLSIEPGYYTARTMKRLDEERVLRAKYARNQQTKSRRKEKRLKRKREDAIVLKNPKNQGYGAGLYP